MNFAQRVYTVLVTATAISGLLTPPAAGTGVPRAGEATTSVYPRGYVARGNLRGSPVQASGTIIVSIRDQWVEIGCWVDGGDDGFGSHRWLKAHYYGKSGYLSSGVVTSRPVVGHC